MATYIRSVDGKVQVEIEPGSPATLLPNIGTQGIQKEIDDLEQAITTYRGQPVVVTDASDMADELTIYLYMGSESGYNANHWYYYDGAEWVDGGEYIANPVLIDDTLTQSGEAADAKVTGDEISALKADLEQSLDLIDRIESISVPFEMELGNITMTATGAVYSASSSRVRNPELSVYNVEKGDVVGFNSYDNITYYVGVLYDENTMYTRGWLTADHIVEASGRLYLLARYRTESAITDISRFKPFVRKVDYSVNTLKTQMANVQFDIDSLKNGKVFPELIAHGGFSAIYPEDTIVSMFGAKKYGFAISGTDLRLTADNHFVCCHDETVDRTTDGNGTISSMTLAQVKECNIDKWGSYGTLTWRNLKIPTLEEYLEASIRANIVPMLETRNFPTARLENLLTIIKSYNLENVAIIESFSTTELTWIRNRSKIKLCALLDATSTNVDYCASLGNCWIGINASLNAPSSEFMNYAISKGVTVLAWTVNLYDKVEELANLGVKYVYTDRQITANDLSGMYKTYYKTIADVDNNNPDSWGFRFYVDNMINSYNLPCTLNKSVAHLQCEIYSAGDSPTLKFCGTEIPLPNASGDWQIVDFTGLMLNSQFALKLESPDTNVQMKNVSIIFMDV